MSSLYERLEQVDNKRIRQDEYIRKFLDIMRDPASYDASGNLKLELKEVINNLGDKDNG